MLINVCTVEGLVSLIFDVMSLQLIMKRRRKGPNTQPGLARQHLLDKYCDVPLLILYKLDIFSIFTSQLENPAELQLQEILLDTKKVKIILNGCL